LVSTNTLTDLKTFAEISPSLVAEAALSSSLTSP
jgi:hypothetical protein